MTGALYGGDPYYRLSQEVLLGIGGVRMLRALGHTELMRYHMNEGHAALLTMELLEEETKRAGRTAIKGEDIERVRSKCVFTTHTPVPAGHDKFPAEYLSRLLPDQVRFIDVKDASSVDLIKSILQAEQAYPDWQEAAQRGASVSMTYLALSLSNYVNGVAKLQGKFPGRCFQTCRSKRSPMACTRPRGLRRLSRISSIAISPPGARTTTACAGRLGLPPEEVWAAHLLSKHSLLEAVRKKSGLKLDPEAFTIGFARRATDYKRADLILKDLDRLRQIAKNVGPFQIVYAGKAHPRDAGGKEIIKKIFRAKKALKKAVTIAFLDDYNLELGVKLTSGVDLWLNTPQYPWKLPVRAG